MLPTGSKSSYLQIVLQKYKIVLLLVPVSIYYYIFGIFFIDLKY